MDKEAPQLAQVDIGALLASKRQNQGVDVKSAAKMVKLSADVIEKLEANRFTEIGTAVYVRGYLGLYAKYLGLDAAEIISLFNSQVPSEDIAIRPALSQPIGGHKRQKSQRHSKTLSFLIAGLLFGGLVYGYFKLEPMLFTETVSQQPSVQPVQLASSDDTQSPVESIITQTDGVQNLADDALQGVPINTGNSASSTDLVSDLEINLNSLEDTSDAGETTAQDREADTQNTENTPPAEVANNAEQNNTDTTTETAADATASLSITFSDDCWLQIEDATGKVLVSGIYGKKRSVNVSGKSPFALKTPRGYAVKTLTFNGQAANLQSYLVKGSNYQIK